MKVKWFLLIFFTLITGCSTLQLTPVDFSWPLEAVLKIDEQGFVKEERYSIKLNVKNLFAEEFGLPTDIQGKTIRIIRNSPGIYFITSEGFKNVYLFNQELGNLSLHKKIPVSEKGLQNPFFNQRDSHIELVDGNLKVLLSNDGIIGDKK